MRLAITDDAGKVLVSRPLAHGDLTDRAVIGIIGRLLACDLKKPAHAASMCTCGHSAGDHAEWVNGCLFRRAIDERFCPCVGFVEADPSPEPDGEPIEEMAMRLHITVDQARALIGKAAQ